MACTLGAEISVYTDNSEGLFRYTARDTDIPGCIDLAYQEWNDASRKWEDQAVLSCLDAVQFEALVRAGRAVFGLQEDVQ